MKKQFCIPLACIVVTLFALCGPMFGQDQARTKPLKLQLRYAEPITHGSNQAERFATFDRALQAEPMVSATSYRSSSHSCDTGC